MRWNQWWKFEGSQKHFILSGNEWPAWKTSNKCSFIVVLLGTTIYDVNSLKQKETNINAAAFVGESGKQRRTAEPELKRAGADCR